MCITPPFPVGAAETPRGPPHFWSGFHGQGLVPGQLAVATVGLGALVAAGGGGPWLGVAGAAALVPLGGSILGLVGSVRGGPAIRERAWEIQAIGAGLLAAAWIAARSTIGP